MASQITGYLGGLDRSQLLYGAIIGILVQSTMVVPLTKLFSPLFTLFSEQIYEPITVLILASMVTLIWLDHGLLARYLQEYPHKQEVETLKTAFPGGRRQSRRVASHCLEHLFKNVIATGVGGAVGGALSMLRERIIYPSLWRLPSLL